MADLTHPTDAMRKVADLFRASLLLALGVALLSVAVLVATAAHPTCTVWP
jgi:hypothetical protein